MDASREAEREFVQERSIIIAELDIEQVNQFKYLGSYIQANNDCEPEIQARISSAYSAAGSLSGLLRSRLLSRGTKLKIYTTVIRPIAMYGSEVWAMTRRLEAKVDSFENNILKTICGPVYDQDLNIWRRRYAREVRALTRLPLISSMIRAGRLRWAGHVIRADDARDIKQVFLWRPDGRRPRGRPRTRWWDNVREDLTLLDEDPDDFANLAADRSGWRALVSAAKTLRRVPEPD